MSKKRNRKSNILRNVLIVLVVIVVAVRLVLPLAVVKIANKVLPDALKTQASIGAIHLSVLGGYVSVQDIVIEQPEGFAGDPLLSAPFVAVKVRMSSLLSKPVAVERVTLRDASVYLQKDKEGRMNTDLLGDKTEVGPESEGGTPEAEVEAESDGEGGHGEGGQADEVQTEPADVAVLLKRLVVEKFTFAMSDHSYEEPLELRLSPIDVVVTNVIFDPSRSAEKVLPGGTLITAKMIQEPRGEAQIGIKARIGILGTDVPAVDGVARISGVELAPLSAVVPPGVAQTLGGSCLDIYADIAMAPDVLDVQAWVKTAGANFGIGVGGTPKEPKPDTSSALFAVFGRFGGSVGNLAGNVGGAGLEVGEAAVETVGAVGMGAVKTVGSLGKGLFKTAKGVVTADMSEIGEGLKGATVGTVGEAAGIVTGAAKELGEGVVETGSASVGIDDAGEWRDAVSTRWAEEWEKAQALLSTMHFPRPKEEPEPEMSEAGEETSEAVDEGEDSTRSTSAEESVEDASASEPTEDSGTGVNGVDAE